MSIELGVADEMISDAVLTADGHRLYVAVHDFLQKAGAIVVLDASTLTEVQRLPGTPDTTFLAGAPDSRYVYSARRDYPDFGLHAFDVTNGSDTQLLNVVGEVHDLAVSPSGRFLFVLREDGLGPDVSRGLITVFDAQSRTAAAQIDVQFAAGILAVSPDGRRLHVGSGI
ncbi:YncE family protein [Nocardia sp. NPDC051750]|uniref:YncE family protein n=1 Tax=Nocardia sp. NPDC051750 TaxID=3364325 RepID=UPI0037A51024